MYVFFCQMPKTKARSGEFQKGADLPAIWQAGVRSNPDFIGTVNVWGITKKDIHMLLKPARHREASAEADGQFGDFNPPEAD